MLNNSTDTTLGRRPYTAPAAVQIAVSDTALGDPDRAIDAQDKQGFLLGPLGS